MTSRLLDFLIHLVFALIVMAMIPVLVLMLIGFTLADALARLRSKPQGRPR